MLRYKYIVKMNNKARNVGMSRNNKTFGRIILLLTYSVIHPFHFLSTFIFYCVIHFNFVIICFLWFHICSVLLNSLHSSFTLQTLSTPPLKTLLKKTVRSKRVQGCLPFLSFISRIIVSDQPIHPSFRFYNRYCHNFSRICSSY